MEAFKILCISIGCILIMISCSTTRKTLDFKKEKVIIIGAGISGLAAENFLHKKGIETIVLEARNEVGGRLRTNRNLNIPFDEGASWIHGSKQNPITKLAKKSKIETYITNDERIEIYDVDGTLYKDRLLEDREKQYNSILKTLEGKRDISFETAFYNQNPQHKKDRLWNYMLSAYLEFDTGSDISQLSSVDFYDDKAFKGEDKIVTNGYDKITSYLSKDLTIVFNTVVTNIEYKSKSVQVSTEKKKYTGDRVIVTVPLGVLKKNKIKFNPELPVEKQHAIERLQMGTVNKYLLIWDEPFWNTELDYIGYTPQEKGKFNYFLNMKKFMKVNALMTFTFGTYSKTIENKADSYVIQEILAHLQSIYGEKVKNPIYFLRTKWNSDPFTYGAYSFATNGIRSEAFNIIAKPIQSKIYFAGEHTSKAYRGTVHGAYISGIKAAKSIYKQMKKAKN